MSKITYEDKTIGSQFSAEDAQEIKTVVNELDDSVATKTSVSDIKISNRIAELISRASNSFKNNVRVNGVMSSPPTVTYETGLPSGFTKTYKHGTLALGVSADSPFLVIGGDAKFSTGDQFFVPATTEGLTGGNSGDGKNATAWRIALMTDAPKIALRLKGTPTPFKFIVDGQYISSLTYTHTSSGLPYISLDFTTSKPREIIIEGTLAATFVSAHVQPIYNVWKPNKGLTALWIGDSFTAGTGATWSADGYAFVMADHLGIKNFIVSGSGGTGYTNPGTGKYTFIQRMQDFTGKNLDIAFIAGGVNDSDDEFLTPAVSNFLIELREVNPDIPIVILGVFTASTGPSNSRISVENKVKAGVQQILANDKLAVFIPITTDITGSWDSGTGKVGAVTGLGSSDIHTGTDGTHPTDSGHFYLGYRGAVAAIRALRSLI